LTLVQDIAKQESNDCRYNTLLLVKNKQNLKLLINFLDEKKEIDLCENMASKQKREKLFSQLFRSDDEETNWLRKLDLIITDQSYLTEYNQIFKQLKSSIQYFIPILLLGEKNDPWVYKNLGTLFDDVAIMPVAKKMLQNKINNMLQIRQAWKELKTLKNKYSLIFNNINDAVFILQYQQQKGVPLKFIEINDKMAEIMQASREQILTMQTSEIVQRFFSQVDLKEMKKEISNKGEAKFETEIKSFAEENIVVEINAQLTRLANNKCLLCVARDIREHKAQKEKLQYAFFHDHLTGLYNRRFFETEMERLDTERQLPLTIIMADINGLKIINDSYGHEKGDEMLKKAGNIIKEVVRSEDIVARIGGDEFGLILPETEEKKAGEICQRIEDQCSKSFQDELPISLGIGMSSKKSSEQDIYDVFDQADSNMQKDKLISSRSTKNRVVKGLLNTLGTKTAETEEHTIRMTKMALDLGSKLKLDKKELNNLILLASLHDVGKVVIPEEILNKPTKLNEEEWEIIQEHPERGYRIALATKEFAQVAEHILSHHEKWDGSGYPQGLEKDEIPLLSRIIAIIDAYDVMTNGRPYQEAKTQEEALEEIKACAGSQFDPKLADKFVELMNEGDL